MRDMAAAELQTARLNSRAVIAVSGEDWRSFLQGLVTQDVETLTSGELRFGALLTPQGRVLFDLFLVGRSDGCWIDCAADRRDDLIQRLAIYRLRAKVTIASEHASVFAAWGAADAPFGWARDPRLPDLGYRRYGEFDEDRMSATEADYEVHRLRLGVPGSADWGSDRTYPIEADFDLLNGIDFKKGCFVGQETTSRMKRRGAIKSRMAPIAFKGPPPAPGAELLAGDLRAGEVLSIGDGLAMALLRLDRLGSGPFCYGDVAIWRPVMPPWLDAVKS